MLVFARGSAAVFVYDQPGAEAILADQMMSNQSKIEGYGQRTFSTTFIPEGLKSYRGSETSGLPMLLVRACGAETFVPWMLLERAGVQSQTSIVGVLLLKSVVCVFSIPYLTE
ncbi:hypothetical protein DY000_02005445 [Brassica cretica]|uniref:Uncharacterized protein n=1 Tax=Brassica cretica TaxID=69181 RepID=A0ABQ7BWW8_BRACR|nr:hypothetical protein DY000_02005445 [Brassica cretica]